jgi:Flp pilus assembly protein TadD
VARTRAAEALARLGRWDEARGFATRAAALPGGGAAPWTALAEADRGSGDLLGALRAHLEGLRRDPDDPWAWASLGRTLLRKGAVSDAVEPLTRAATLAPGWREVEELLGALRAEVDATGPGVGPEPIPMGR